MNGNLPYQMDSAEMVPDHYSQQKYAQGAQNNFTLSTCYPTADTSMEETRRSSGSRSNQYHGNEWGYQQTYPERYDTSTFADYYGQQQHSAPYINQNENRYSHREVGNFEAEFDDEEKVLTIDMGLDIVTTIQQARDEAKKVWEFIIAPEGKTISAIIEELVNEVTFIRNVMNKVHPQFYEQLLKDHFVTCENNLAKVQPDIEADVTVMNPKTQKLHYMLHLAEYLLIMLSHYQLLLFIPDIVFDRMRRFCDLYTKVTAQVMQTVFLTRDHLLYEHKFLKLWQLSRSKRDNFTHKLWKASLPILDEFLANAQYMTLEEENKLLEQPAIIKAKDLPAELIGRVEIGENGRREPEMMEQEKQIKHLINSLEKTALEHEKESLARLENLCEEERFTTYTGIKPKLWYQNGLLDQVPEYSDSEDIPDYLKVPTHSSGFFQQLREHSSFTPQGKIVPMQNERVDLMDFSGFFDRTVAIEPTGSDSQFFQSIKSIKKDRSAEISERDIALNKSHLAALDSGFKAAIGKLPSSKSPVNRTNGKFFESRSYKKYFRVQAVDQESQNHRNDRIVSISRKRTNFATKKFFFDAPEPMWLNIRRKDKQTLYKMGFLRKMTHIPLCLPEILHRSIRKTKMKVKLKGFLDSPYPYFTSQLEEYCKQRKVDFEFDYPYDHATKQHSHIDLAMIEVSVKLCAWKCDLDKFSAICPEVPNAKLVICHNFPSWLAENPILGRDDHKSDWFLAAGGYLAVQKHLRLDVAENDVVNPAEVVQAAVQKTSFPSLIEVDPADQLDRIINLRLEESNPKNKTRLKQLIGKPEDSPPQIATKSVISLESDDSPVVLAKVEPPKPQMVPVKSRLVKHAQIEYQQQQREIQDSESPRSRILKLKNNETESESLSQKLSSSVAKTKPGGSSAAEVSPNIGLNKLAMINKLLSNLSSPPNKPPISVMDADDDDIDIFDQGGVDNILSSAVKPKRHRIPISGESTVHLESPLSQHQHSESVRSGRVSVQMPKFNKIPEPMYKVEQQTNISNPPKSQGMEYPAPTQTTLPETRNQGPNTLKNPRSDQFSYTFKIRLYLGGFTPAHRAQTSRKIKEMADFAISLDEYQLIKFPN